MQLQRAERRERTNQIMAMTRRKHLQLLGMGVICVWLVVSWVLCHYSSNVIINAGRQKVRQRRSFSLIANVESEAASGIMTFVDSAGLTYLAVSCYYGMSAVYSFDPMSFALLKLQDFPSTQAQLKLAVDGCMQGAAAMTS